MTWIIISPEHELGNLGFTLSVLIWCYSNCYLICNYRFYLPMNNKLILLWIIFNCYYSFGQVKSVPEAQQLGFVLPEGYDKVTIPFVIHNNLIVIDVLLNRSLPLKFVLDTGVRSTVLTDKSLTDLLNLTYARKITIPGAGGEKLVDAFVVNNVTMNIGKIEGNGHAILVLETDLLQLKNYLGVNVHGILGYELFSRFVVDINYSKKVIIFSNPATFKKKKSFVELPITVEDTKPFLETNFLIRGSVPFTGKFMVDTGASHTILLDTRSNTKITVPEPNISTTLGRGLGGNIYGNVARIDKLSIDKYLFKGVIATFPDDESYEISFSRNSRNGTLGGGLLRRFHVVFDYVHSKMYMRKGSGYFKPFEFDLSGLVVKAKGVYLRDYEIDAVRINSNAAVAGLKVGDQILQINGVKSNNIDLEQLISKLNDKANKKVRLVILRNGQSINVQFKLRRMI